MNMQSQSGNNSAENMKIKVSENSLGVWNSVEIPVRLNEKETGRIDISDIIYYNEQFFVAINVQDSISFYVSKNLEDWSEFYTSNVRGGGYFIDINHKLLFLTGQDILVLNNNVFDHITLVEPCYNIYYMNNIWYGIGSFSYDNNYVLSGNNLDELKQCYSTYKYEKRGFPSKNIISNDNLLIGLAQESNYECCIFTSSDGYKWEENFITLCRPSLYFRNIKYFDNNIYIETDRHLFIYYPETKSFRLAIHYGDYTPSLELKNMRFFDNYGIYLYRGHINSHEHNNYIYISNTIGDWRDWTRDWIRIYDPKDMNYRQIQSFSFAKKYFFMWSGNELIYREIKNTL